MVRSHPLYPAELPGLARFILSDDGRFRGQPDTTRWSAAPPIRDSRTAESAEARASLSAMVDTLHQLATISAPLAITMVVPAERIGLNAAFDSHLNRMLAEAELDAAKFSNKRLSKRAVRNIERALERLDRTHLSHGVWIGAVPGRVLIHHLDDEVSPHIKVSTTLNLMPLVRQSRRTNALVLLLTETGCRLFVYNTGGETLHQRIRPLKVRGMPTRFHGEGGRQGREAGSDQRDDRYRQWMRKVARLTATTHASVPAVSALPLVVVGIDRYLGFLGEVSDDLHISAVVRGSPDAFTTSDLDQLIAAEVNRLRDARAVATLARAAMLIGMDRVSTDLAETKVWAGQGRIDALLVEDDTDADELAETALHVLSRAGEVVSAPPGAVTAALPSLTPATWVALLRW